jgi:putative nucleotidyltransferase with HDIG domain
VTDAAPHARPRLAVGLAAAVACVGLIGFALADHDSLLTRATGVLVVVAVGARLTISEYSGSLGVSPVFVCGMLAVAFVGPAGAFAVVLLAELAGWAMERYRWQALLVNVAGSSTPTFLVAVGFSALAAPQGSPSFYALLAGATCLALILNATVVISLASVLDGLRIGPRLRATTHLLPTAAISTLLVLTVAAAYIDLGASALAFLLITLSAIAYMSRLVAHSRAQARQYANLSWGVLSALVRTLNERDHRAARHCAAVAMFARDMARASGMDEREQELAHTSGLLHDIGKFVLSDRVMERGAQLNEIDWRGIRRHPDIGADLLKDIGVFGPIGEIIRAHHERIDGRGYPRGLKGDQIPEVAKIVAVAEIYDTLTAPDTYRTPMTSFEALTELRRVAGLQVDGKYVEALAELLAGRGTDYRHQDEADFDRELDMERRMSQAAAPL